MGMVFTDVEPGQRPVPVSYTHLDVYKRQPSGGIIFAWNCRFGRKRFVDADSCEGQNRCCHCYGCVDETRAGDGTRHSARANSATAKGCRGHAARRQLESRLAANLTRIRREKF